MRLFTVWHSGSQLEWASVLGYTSIRVCDARLLLLFVVVVVVDIVLLLLLAINHHLATIIIIITLLLSSITHNCRCVVR